MSSYVYIRKAIDRQFQHVDCIRWAPDGRIAILSNTQVLVLQYPSASTDADFTCHQVVPSVRSQLVSTGTLEAQDGFVTGVFPIFMQRSSMSDDNPMQLVQMDWSPAGCSWDGGCLLAVVTSQGIAEVFEPPMNGLDYDWARATDISDLLVDYLRSVDFDIVRPVPIARRNAKLHGAKRGASGALDPSVWLARRLLVTVRCATWAPCIWSFPPTLPPSTLLAVGSRGMLCLFVFSAPTAATGGVSPGSFMVPDREPAVIIPARDLSCLAWHVDWSFRGAGGGGSADGHSMNATGSTSSAPEAILATGSSNGAVHIYRVRFVPGDDEEEEKEDVATSRWELLPLRELSRAGLRHTHCLSFHASLPHIGLALVAGLGSSMHVWSMADGGTRVQVEVEAHDEVIVSVGRFRTLTGGQGDGPCLISGALDGTLKVWSVKEGPEGIKFYHDPTIMLSQPRFKQGVHLLGLAMSPNQQLLATVRSVPTNHNNSREKQTIGSRRHNRGALVVAPLFQSGYRSVHMPDTLASLLRMADWPPPSPAPAPFHRDAMMWPDVRPLTDILMLASVDTSVMMEMQFNPYFFTPKPQEPQPPSPQDATENGHVDPTLLPKHPATILAASVASRLTSFPDLDLEGGAVVGPGPGTRTLLALQLVYSVHAHLLTKMFHSHPQQKPECEGHMSVAGAYITAHHIYNSLTRLLSLVTTPASASAAPPPPLMLPSRERRAVLNMVKWIRSREQWAEEKSPLPGEVGGWRSLADKVMASCVRPQDGEEHEVCFICGAVVPWEAEGGRAVKGEACCAAGHPLFRCMETLCIIDSVDFWECRSCLRKARPYNVPSPIIDPTAEEEESQEEDHPSWRRPPWMLPPEGLPGSTGVWCMFCRIPCVLSNR